MNYRELGRTGLMVSEISLGCEGYSAEDHAFNKALIDLAEETGVNYLDMFIANPKVRKSLGECVKGRREKFIIQGHIGAMWTGEQYKRTRIPEQVKADFETMLELTGFGYLDVGMIHCCDAMEEWNTIMTNGMMDLIRRWKAEGKIRHIGLSTHNPEIALAAAKGGEVEVIMFSVNPCYDMQPAGEIVEELWNEENYKNPLVNMDPQRQEVYEVCQNMGIGITAMKAFSGGDLLDETYSPAGKALTVNQCIHYCLTRPAVATVVCGCRAVEELPVCVAYCDATDAEKDYAETFAQFPRISWEGHCMYCTHCSPCAVAIDVASVTKYLNLAKTQGTVPETVQAHYDSLAHHAGECIQCGACETRCPFKVNIRENMRQAAEVFGK